VQSVVFSALASVYLLLTGPVTGADAITLDSFKEIGKTSYGVVFIDTSSVKLDKDREGGLIAGMMVKVKLNKPQRGTHAVVNAVVFSCNAEAAMVVASTALDEKGAIINSSEQKSTIPWVKGSDSATHVIMEKLCRGHEKPLPRGTLTT
jgi:hypothetical protein